MSQQSEALKKKMKGIFHLVVTHFDEKGNVDEAAIRKAVRYSTGAFQGEDAVFVTTGSTAEFYALTDEECLNIINIVVDEVNGEFPVLAGTARGGTKWTIELSRAAQDAGADGVLIVNPYYQLATHDGLYRHFEQTASSIDIGIMIYNNPVHSKLWIPPPLMAKLSKIDNIVAVKENTESAAKFYWMQRAVDPEDLVIICGIGHIMYPFEALFDCPGFFTEFGNFAPQIAIAIYRAFCNRDHTQLKELTDRIAPYFDLKVKLGARRGELPTVLSPYICSSGVSVYQSILKQSMEIVGLPGGRVREPVENISKQEKEELREVLHNIGVC
ncbi:MAG: dihydrodipicolinate synthase family protein [Planctomycetes bacterium]|nr:dihydrodipicolinate synthase family protein [Planctomycetota bacterium]